MDKKWKKNGQGASRKMAWLFLLLLPLLFVLEITDCAATSKKWVTVIRVVDGDTLVIKYRDKEEKVRLIGMDTPEVSYNWKTKRDMEKSGKNLKAIIAQGKEASNFVKKLVRKGLQVELEFDVQKIEPPRNNKPARLLAYVYLPDGRMLNEEIVKAGYGQVYTVPPNVKYVKRFKKAEQEARNAKMGLWRY
jgi:micrococcal nuclease